MFVSAMSLILGIHSGQVKNIDARMQSLGVKHAIQLDAQTACKAGVAAALSSLRRAEKANAATAAVKNGKFDYTITNYTGPDGTPQARIVCTGEQKGIRFQTIVIAKNVEKNKWQLVRLAATSFSGQLL
jgi:hypothetical protein